MSIDFVGWQGLIFVFDLRRPIASQSRGLSEFMIFVSRLIPIAGVALLIAANVSGLMREQGFGPLQYALGAAGMAFFLTILWNRRGAGQGRADWTVWAKPAIYTALVFGCCLLLYLISLQHNRAIDLTSTRTYSLSDLTERVLEGLDRPVRLVAFTELPRETEAYFARFAAISPRITYEIRDPIRDLAAAQSMESQVLPEDIFVIAEKSDGTRRQKRLSSFDKLDEGAIVNAIIEVTRDTARKLYFTTGHGERATQSPGKPAPNQLDPAISAAVRLIGERAFEVEEWPIIQNGFIPADCAALIMAGPVSDPSPAVLDVIRAYLAGGGKMLLMLDPPRSRSARFEGMQQLLLDYDLVAPDAYVLDDNALTGRGGAERALTALVAMKNPSNPIVQNLPTGQVMMMPFARPILKNAKPSPGVNSEELLYTGNGSWLADTAAILVRGEIPPPNPEAQRPLPVTSIAWKSDKALSGAGSRLFVTGDSDMFTNDIINEASMVLLLNAINWLTENESQIAIPPRMMPNTPLVLSARQGRVLFAALVITIPSLILIGGLGYTVRRRRTR